MNRIIAVVGGGAAGCMAAVSAARSAAGEPVQIILLEAGKGIGAKIRITGNGRCNLTNLQIRPEHYYSVEQADPMRIYEKYSPDTLRSFFEERGVFLHSRGDLIYPLTDRADTVAELFERELHREKVQVQYDARIREIRREGKRFLLRDEHGNRWQADAVILATGGLTGKRLGCRGDGYALSQQIGLHVTDCFPALTYLKTDCAGLAAADGVRCEAELKLLIGDKAAAQERGELQLTKKGLSGIVCFQISHPAAQALRTGREAILQIDFAPDITDDQLRKQILERMKKIPEENPALSELFFGMIHPGAAAMIIRSSGQVEERKARKLHPEELMKLLKQIKAFRVRITGTGDYEEAQVTAGGVRMKDLNENLEAADCEGLYLCGELLDVDGLCGGYNLTFAMCSGAVCGMAAAEKISRMISQGG